MNRFALCVSALALIACAGPDDGWEKYEAGSYGFSMLVPEGTKFKEKEWDGGWGGLHADYQGIKLYGCAKLCEDISDKDIEKFGVKITGIGSDHWKVIDKGENSNGWRRYRTVRADNGAQVAFGGYGTGPAGTYVLVMVTTGADYKENKKSYDKWYESVKLHRLTAAPKGWKMYKAADYGYSMFVADGTKLKEKEWKDGWGGLHAEYEGIKLYGLAHENKDHKAEAIEKFALKITGCKADDWTVIDKGKNRKGWSWYYTVKATYGDKVAFGGYGAGKKGSFLLVLVTTKDDFKKHQINYRMWYGSVVLN